MDEDIMKLLKEVESGETSASDAFLNLYEILSQYGFDIGDY